MAKQERSNSNWEAMLKRWAVDKTTHHRALPSSTNVFDHPRLRDGTDSGSTQWRGKAKEWYMTREPPKYYYVCDRVYDISGNFNRVGRDPIFYSDSEEDEDEDEEEDWLADLKELQEYAEFTDIVSVLHSEGCLFSFLHDALSNKNASVRAKIAEVVTTMVQNYPTSQQLLINDKALQLLLNNFTSDPDETSRTKTLGAISSLIWNNKSGITAFRREKGYAALRKALVSGSVCQREVVNLIEHLLHENDLYSQKLNLNLASSDDSEAREAALSGLLVLRRRKGKNRGHLVKNADKLKQVKEESLDALPPTVESNPDALPTVESNSSSTFQLLKKKKKKRSNSSSKGMKLH